MEKEDRLSSLKDSLEQLKQKRIAQQQQKQRAAVEGSFGIWKNKPVDPIDYQKKIRDEWD